MLTVGIGSFYATAVTPEILELRVVFVVHGRYAHIAL